MPGDILTNITITSVLHTFAPQAQHNELRVTHAADAIAEDAEAVLALALGLLVVRR